MHVIEVSPKASENMHKMKCNNCESIIGYNNSDIITDYNYSDFTDIMSAILGEKEMVAKYVVKCPVCGEYVNITYKMTQNI